MNNLVRQTLLYLAVAFIAFIILTPLVFLVNTSLSSQNELSDFPQRMTPSLTIDVVYRYDAATEGYILARRMPDGRVQDLFFSASYDRLSDYLNRYLNVSVDEDTLREQLLPTRTDNQWVEQTYLKGLLDNYIKFFDVFSGAGAALRNSMQAAAYTILISLSLGGLVGYALARTTIKGKEIIGLGTLVVRMFPVVSISVPLAVLLIRYGMYDTMLGLAFIYSVPNIGLTAWITRGIFLGIDKELEEASYVFGANKRQTFSRITLPLVLPAFAASSMYAFITAWNDTAVSLLLTNRNQTLALLIYRSIGRSASDIHYAASGAVLLILPALVFTFLLKNYINRLWG
jgi:multiple sugar transport system permease protein